MEQGGASTFIYNSQKFGRDRCMPEDELEKIEYPVVVAIEEETFCLDAVVVPIRTKLVRRLGWG